MVHLAAVKLPAEAVSAPPPRYRAFLSYSHRDAAAARALHRRLEGYRVPRRLVGRETGHGRVPGRFAPVFRDREELPARDDLGAAVREALASSAALIVVASPAAAASRWVGREIETFRETCPGCPILVALVDGEPAAALPPALRASGQEPLAADLRPHADGRRLGTLKLVAGLAGLPLDDLIRRDDQRRRRRVMVITLAAAAAILIMALLTAWAIVARADAEAERGRAEKLVEFMLTDLRDRLKGVGRLDVLADANRAALEYFSGQDLSALSPAALERRARLLHAMGEDDIKRGDLDAALAQFREAERVTRTLVADDPDNPDRVFGHAQSTYWIGHVDERRGDFPAALRAYRSYLADARRLTAIDPDRRRALTELAYAHSNIGIVELNGLNRPAAAQAAFARALGYFKAAGRLRPGDAGLRMETADAHAWLSDALAAGGHRVAARAERLAAATIQQALATAEPRNLQYRYAMLVNARSIARLDLELGAAELALQRLLPVVPIARQLVENDPTNGVWAEQEVRLALDVAQASGRLCRLKLAWTAITRARALLEGAPARRIVAGNRKTLLDRLVASASRVELCDARR